MQQSINDTVNAFVLPHYINLGHQGKLAGTTFAVKDIFDIENLVTGFGHPRWLQTHAPATATHPTIKTLLQQGAILLGKTIMDELAFATTGINIHYGTPININAPQHLPGGSSSGSAAATAANLVNFALGSDSGGSIRIPASYCGIYGFRPSLSLLSSSNMIALSPSFDTAGWVANDMETLCNVGDIVLPTSNTPINNNISFLIFETLFKKSPATENLLIQFKHFLAERQLPYQMLNKDEFFLKRIYRCYSSIIGYEAWQTHKQWFLQQQPTLCEDVANRYQWSSSITQDQYNKAVLLQQEIKKGFFDLFTDPNAYLCIPTTPDIAPLLTQSNGPPASYHACIASLMGSPELTLPLFKYQDIPMGISIIGLPSQDRNLLQQITILLS